MFQTLSLGGVPIIGMLCYTIKILEYTNHIMVSSCMTPYNNCPKTCLFQTLFIKYIVEIYLPPTSNHADVEVLTVPATFVIVCTK